jgi:hypothetical protein
MFPVSVATVVSVSVFASNLNVALIILRTYVIYKTYHSVWICSYGKGAGITAELNVQQHVIKEEAQFKMVSRQFLYIA